MPKISKGQVSIEFAVLVAVIIAALVTMQIYLRRGISGKLRKVSDSMGEQYDPGNTESNLTTAIVSDTDTFSEPWGVTLRIVGGGAPGVVEEERDAIPALITATRLNNSTTTKTGTETVGELGRDLWR